MVLITSKLAFAIVSFALGEIGDGLSVFQGTYLVSIGWNEGAVGLALSLIGLTALIVQTYAGDIVDRTTVDRRVLLALAALSTAGSAMAILFVREGNKDHFLIYLTKIIEGIASSFIVPCLAALTLANFGHINFDEMMASNIYYSHVGCATSAILVGGIAYIFYPHVNYCFFVLGFSALLATIFVKFLPEGDPLVGRGFHNDLPPPSNNTNNQNLPVDETKTLMVNIEDKPQAASYWSVFTERKTLILCTTGFFFRIANTNVLLVLGELMGKNGDDDDDGNNNEGSNRLAIPLIAGAIILSQVVMCVATIVGDHYTSLGVGRKVIFTAGLTTLPIRCALIIYWKDAGSAYLLSTQVLDGLGSGLFALIYPYLVADITFGTGRFNVIMGMTASSFGLGGTISYFCGQVIVEKFGHVVSLSVSMIISLIPIAIFTILMPETLNTRGKTINDTPDESKSRTEKTDYGIML